jgi:hypothetical protein
MTLAPGAPRPLSTRATARHPWPHGGRPRRGPAKELRMRFLVEDSYSRRAARHSSRPVGTGAPRPRVLTGLPTGTASVASPACRASIANGMPVLRPAPRRLPASRSLHAWPGDRHMPDLIAPSTPRRPRRKRWVECADARHATECPSTAPGDVVLALCGESVTVVVATPGRYAPECLACDRRWRADEGIPQREAHIRRLRPRWAVS